MQYQNTPVLKKYMLLNQFYVIRSGCIETVFVIQDVTISYSIIINLNVYLTAEI